MFHTFAYSGSVASVSETDLPALPDGIMVVQNNHLLPQQDLYMKYAFAASALLQRARIITPTFRQLSPPYLRPTNVGVLPVDLTPVADYSQMPLKLRALEETQALVTNSGAGAGINSVIIGIGDNASRSVPVGDTYTLRATSVTAAVVQSWTQIALTWQDVLPNGTYVCTGLNHISTTGVAARLIFQNQVWRPGCISGATLGLRPSPIFRRGTLGPWGQFAGNAMPNCEALCQAADAAHEIYMDYVRIA